MPKPRVFVSSTCYDLHILRSELRPFVVQMGYEPVMSDFSDVLYDPRSHTHDSCLKDVPTCDMLVLIVGARFGGEGIPEAVAQLDYKALLALSTRPEVLTDPGRLSITQLEVLKAVEQSVPVYAFVDEKVLHDHHVYERNKGNAEIIDKIEFPSIQRRETAKYIFEFINFLTHRRTNNSITGFSRLDEIRQHLTSQWSQLFQRLLQENRTATRDTQRYQDFAERIEDLKAVVLASVATPDLRLVARAILQFRRLVDFVGSLQFVDPRSLLLSERSWDEVLETARISEIRQLPDSASSSWSAWTTRSILGLQDGTFYVCYLAPSAFDDFKDDWAAFLALNYKVREAVVDTLLADLDSSSRGLLRYHEEQLSEVLSRIERKNSTATEVKQS